MNGVAQTVLRLVCFVPLQRWLLGIGAALMGIGFGTLAFGGYDVARSIFIFDILGGIGVLLALMPSVMLDGVVFRALSAPRAMHLIPGARLRMLLGAFTTQLLMAGLIGAGLATILSSSPAHRLPWDGFGARAAAATVVALAVLTVHFWGFFCTSASRYGTFFWVLGYIVLPRLLINALAPWHLRELFVTAAAFEALLAVTVLTWLCFGIGYLRARRLRMPHRPGMGLGHRTDPHAARDVRIAGQLRYTQRESLRILLSGSPRRRLSGFFITVFGLLGFFVLVVLSTGINGSFRDNALFLAGVVCMLAGPVAGGYVGWLANRSRLLWLPCALGRIDIYHEIESRGWVVVSVVAGLAAGMAAAWLAWSLGHGAPMIAVPPLLLGLGVLVTPLASGAMLMYATLQQVRGRRAPDLLLLIGCGLIWFLELICVVGGAVSDRPSSATDALLALQIILVPVLRNLAQRRWLHIDWVIFRTVRTPPALT